MGGLSKIPKEISAPSPFTWQSAYVLHSITVSLSSYSRPRFCAFKSDICTYAVKAKLNPLHPPYIIHLSRIEYPIRIQHHTLKATVPGNSVNLPNPLIYTRLPACRRHPTTSRSTAPWPRGHIDRDSNPRVSRADIRGPSEPRWSGWQSGDSKWQSRPAWVYGRSRWTEPVWAESSWDLLVVP